MFDFAIELHRTNELLERIAFALERGVGPILMDPSHEYKKRGKEAIVMYGDDTKRWQREQIKEGISPLGLSPQMEKQLMEQAMRELHDEVEDDPGSR
jgi:hypothetical protein